MAGTGFQSTHGTGLWRTRIVAILWFLLIVGFLLAVPPLFNLSWLIVLADVLVALIIALPIAWIVRRLSSSAREHSYGRSLVTTWVALTLLIGILLAAPIYYLSLQTDLRPLAVPQATLTNGDKTVVFQGMIHIGSEGFYKGVIYDLEKALVDGYVLYYEGVQPSPEGDAWFSEKLAGGGDLSANYQMMSDVCGLTFQLNYFSLLAPDMAARPERHITADVTTADMMHEYERLMQEDPDFAAANADAPAEEAPTAEADAAAEPDLMPTLLAWLANATPAQRDIEGLLCRGYLTMMQQGEDAPDPLDPVVLDFRNQALADRIAADDNKLIYITYGAAHLPGMLADLQAIDPAWEVQTLKWTRTIEAPEDVTGQLAGYMQGG